MPQQGELLVGLDIGTHKICAVIGEVTEQGIDIIGIGTHESKGLRKGVVINIDATVSAIKKAIEEAEVMAGCEISNVYAGIAGSHIKSFNSQGMVRVSGGEVDQSDIVRVIDAARAVAIPSDRKVLHVIPQEYIIDNQGGITKPIGMSGIRLESKVHIVTGSSTSAENIVKCANRCDLSVNSIVLEQLASSEAVLSADEKEIGCALVDIGGGTTDIAIWHRGAIVHTAVLPIGGQHFTNDIAQGLRTPTSDAEKLKRKGGCAMVERVAEDETIEVPSVGDRPPRVLPRKILAEIIQPRAEEVFALVHREIEQSEFIDLIASGVIITGGTVIMEGMPEIAEQVIQVPMRRGLPRGIGGLVDVVRSPKFATSVGLVLYGASGQSQEIFHAPKGNFFGNLARQIRSWFKEVV